MKLIKTVIDYFNSESFRQLARAAANARNVA